MTDEDFFDIGSGTAAPSAKLTDLNDSVAGVVRETFKKEYTKFGEKDPQVITDPKTGQPRNRTQMVVVLDTPLRNWQGVSKIPAVDPNDLTKGVKHPSEDDGTRAVYIPEMVKGAGSNGMIFAVATAMRDEGLRGLPAGTKFFVTIAELKDVEKGNPLKVYDAKVKKADVGADVFEQAQAATAPPAAPAQPQAAPAAPAQQVPATPAAPATPVTDPWSGEQTPAAPAAPAPAATSTPTPPF